MSTIRTKCPHCGRHYEVGEDLVGQEIACSECGRGFAVPKTSAAAGLDQCPTCGGKLAKTAEACPHCGARNVAAGSDFMTPTVLGMVVALASVFIIKQMIPEAGRGFALLHAFSTLAIIAAIYLRRR